MTQEKTIITAEVQPVNGLTLAGRSSSNHWVIMDGKKQVGGNEGGSTPMELVLMAVGGCTGMDVVSILKKMRVEYKDLKISLEADKADEHPKVFTDIRIVYHLWGKDIPLEKVEKAVSLSMEKYCSVSAMIKESVGVSYSIEIHEE
jgi:putative redox protein